MKKVILTLGLALLWAPSLFGAIVFTDLGTGAPPATVGGFAMTPFSQVPQAAIPNLTLVNSIPGGSSAMAVSPAAEKRNVPGTWGTWSHGYTGAVYFFASATSGTLTLPAGTTAFYLYAEPNLGNLAISATSNGGVTGGPFTVNSNSGAHGFAFSTTTPGETITSITVTQGAPGFAIGEFGAATIAATAAVPTLSTLGLLAFVAALAAAGVFLLTARFSA